MYYIHISEYWQAVGLRSTVRKKTGLYYRVKKNKEKFNEAVRQRQTDIN